MATLRFNPFGQIHKGLRALLYDTALLLQHTHFTREEETAKATERVRLVAMMFEDHAFVEDNYVFPMITPYAPEVVEDFEAQHVMDHQIGELLLKAVNQLEEAAAPEEKILAGIELQHQFNAFLAFNVEHMKKEETIVNAVLWKYYTDEQLAQKVQEISGKVEPEKNAIVTEWMLRGMASQEIVTWYSGIKRKAPPQVFEMFCDMAFSVLPEARWTKIREQLFAAKAVS